MIGIEYEQYVERLSVLPQIITNHSDKYKSQKQVAHKLGKLLSTLNKSCHVNLIPLNPTAGFDGAPTKAADCKVCMFMFMCMCMIRQRLRLQGVHVYHALYDYRC